MKTVAVWQPGVTIVNLFCKSCRVSQPCIFDIISISSIIHQDKPLIYRQVRTDQVNRDTGFYKVHLQNSTPKSRDKHITYIKLLLSAWKESTKPFKGACVRKNIVHLWWPRASPSSPVIPRSCVASVWRSGHQNVSSGRRHCATRGSTVCHHSSVMVLQPARQPAAAPPPGVRSQCRPTWTSQLVTWYW